MALSRLAAVFAVQAALVACNEVQKPPCTTPFRPFTYVGCFADNVNDQRSLPFHVTFPDPNNVTVETCTAYCKGLSPSRRLFTRLQIIELTQASHREWL